VLSTRVSHLYPEPKQVSKSTTKEASARGGDVSVNTSPKVHHGAAIAAVFALFSITAALSGSVVYVRRRRSAAALAAAECPLAPSATTTEESEQGEGRNVSPRSGTSGSKSKVTEDGGALGAGETTKTTTTTTTTTNNNNNKNGKNSRRRGGAANNAAAAAAPSGSGTSSDESGGGGAAASEFRPLSAGRRGARSSSARATRKALVPASHRLQSADEAV
jgi:hypothetical protein